MPIAEPRWPLAVAALLLAGSLVDVASFTPSLLIQAFNPLSSNQVVLCLCLVGWRAEARAQNVRSLGQPD